MNLKEELITNTNKKLMEEAQNLAEIIKPILINSASNGYSGTKISLKEHQYPEYIEPYLQYCSSKVFLNELSALLDGISVNYEKEPVTIRLLTTTSTVGYTPYLHFRWEVKQ